MPKLPIDGSFSKDLKDEKNKKYLIVKSNKIVQRTHFSMSLEEQKVLASLIRSIKPHQQGLTVRFSTNQFMQMLGLQKSGTTFASIMHTLHRVADKSFYIKQSDGKYHLWRWLQNVVADPHAKNGGNFLVRFNSELRQYLFNQSLKYRTIYKFSDVMLMRSRYSPRLYEIFRSNQSRQKIQKRGLNYGINELRYALDLMKRNRATGRPMHKRNGKYKFKYPSYSEFRRNVLEPAKHEINVYTEYNIKMKPIRARGRGKRVVAINVTMSKKNERQKTKRDDLIYCMTHHIPKSEWKTWREDKIRGKFHKVHQYTTKHSSKSRKRVINGQFHIVKKHPFEARHEHKVRLFDPRTHKYVWIAASAISDTSEQLSQTEINRRLHQLKKDLDGYFRIYNPVVSDYVWTDQQTARKIIKGYPKYNQ